jgi:3-methyladenine DNA glycosylase AlkD
MPNRRIPKPRPRATSEEMREALRRELFSAKNAKNAAAMQAYIKSAMPFLGIQKDELRAICKGVFDANRLESAERWRDACLAIWRGAEYRDERYAAIELTGHKFYREFQTLDAVPMYTEMIVTGAWWDFVDEIAKWRIGKLLEKYPGPMRKKMLSWSKCRNLWKRRTAILCQLAFKDRTDVRLLYECIEPSLNSKEFFLRKAIGWALREYAWMDAKEIKRYVAAHETELSPLSKREALKNVG